MFKKFRYALVVILVFNSNIFAQLLQPGFDKKEMIDMLKISARFGDSAYFTQFRLPPEYAFVYRSPEMGLLNMWDLWINKKGIAILSVRGTIQKPVSWLANFYAAMVPAKGKLKLSATEDFEYELATNPRAAVHAGWLLSTAFLTKDMLPKIDSLHKTGIKDIIITGHSQGGAIAYLVTAHLYSLQKQGRLPANIRFKTYCTAGAKPGNLYFAYDYEAMTQIGWAFNVVNSADWVPETPFSVQTTDDFNNTNPFSDAKAVIKKQQFPKNLALSYAYNRLDKPTKKARKRFGNYMGDMTEKLVKKQLEGFSPPAYFNSNHYVRTGNTIVLRTDEAYHKLYPDSKENVFMHHLHPPYLYLAEKL
jgi:hypothetical protein